MPEQRPGTHESDFYTLEMGMDEGREEFVTEQLIAYNRAHAPLQEPNDDGQFTAAALHIFALATDGTVIGGLIGRTHSLRAWLEVTTIWVGEAHRRHGIGRSLMERAEEEARRRGCRYARLATSDYQAPGFYTKLGYTQYGKLENCPPGVTVFYFCKTLI
jgi:ribosomal protein S18 acetylase RimI-like enzyme